MFQRLYRSGYPCGAWGRGWTIGECFASAYTTYVTGRYDDAPALFSVAVYICHLVFPALDVN